MLSLAEFYLGATHIYMFRSFWEFAPSADSAAQIDKARAAGQHGDNQYSGKKQKTVSHVQNVNIL